MKSTSEYHIFVLLKKMQSTLITIYDIKEKITITYQKDANWQNELRNRIDVLLLPPHFQF